MNSKIIIERVLPDEFLSDILITAFDGAYGGSWSWFEPIDDEWLVTEGDLWMEVQVRLKEEHYTGKALFDSKDGFVIDHEKIVKAMKRIMDDDYEDVWRRATFDETKDWKTNGSPRGRRYRLVAGKGLMVETGETARAYEESIRDILSSPEPDAGDIDAPFADAIVQVAAFGKVIFG